MDKNKKEKFSISIILIWILTAIAVGLALISLIGLIISRNQKVKKSFLETIKDKTGIEIQDIKISSFPLTYIADLEIKGAKFGNLYINQISISLPKKIVLKKLEVGNDFISDEIKIVGNRIELNKSKFIIIKSSKKTEIPDLKILCEIKEKLFQSKTWDIFLFSQDFIGINVIANDSEIIEENFKANIEKISANIKHGTINGEAKGKISISNLGLIGKVNAKKKEDEIIDTDLKFFSYTEIFGGGGEISFYSEIFSGSIDFSFFLCKESELEFKAKSEISFGISNQDIEADGNILSKIEGKLKDKKISLDISFNMQSENLKIYQENIGKAFISGEARIHEGKIYGSGELKVDAIEKLEFSSEYSPKDKKGNINFFSSIDLSKSRILKKSEGKIKLSGKIGFPDIKGKFDVDAKNGEIENILKIQRTLGSIDIENGILKISAVAYNEESKLIIKGNFNPKNLEASAKIEVAKSKLSDLLKMINVDVPFDSYVKSDDLKFDLYKNTIKLDGNAYAENFEIISEKIRCANANIKTEIDFEGNYSVKIEGVGFDGVIICPEYYPDLENNELSKASKFSFDATVNKKIIDVSLEGLYNLEDLDITPFKMRGKAEFKGKVIRNHKNIESSIDIKSENFKIEDYMVSSSCVIGKIEYRENKVFVSGETCENFLFDIAYNPKKEEIFGEIKKSDTEIKFLGDQIQAKGDIKTLAEIVPLLSGNEGLFLANYKIKEKRGDISFSSPKFLIGNFILTDLKASSQIKENSLDFKANAKYLEEELEAEGKYNLKNKDIDLKINLKGFAGIPLKGDIKVAGNILSPYVSGNLTVENVDLTEKTIAKVRSYIKYGGEVELDEKFELKEEEHERKPNKGEKRGTINLVLNMKNISTKYDIISTNLSGRIHVHGNLDSPKVSGILEIKDGSAQIAEVEFKQIKGIGIIEGEKVFLNIQGQAEVITFENEKYQINIRMIGNLESLNFHLTSKPSLPQSDIMCILVLLRKCKSVEDYKGVLEVAVYRGLYLISKKLEENIGIESTKARPFFTPTEFGFIGKTYGLNFTFSHNVFEGVNKFSLSREISDSVFMTLGWDNKKYGYSLLGNIGNLGLDLKTIRRF